MTDQRSPGDHENVDDVEGHIRHPAAPEADDTEGHFLRNVAAPQEPTEDDDDVEGHKAR